jgi:DNA-binding response OmpR family regulator
MAERHRKALLIAYDPETIRLVEKNLVPDKFDVIIAQNRTEALDKARAEEPDLVILDTEVPIVEATELRQVLKESPNTANSPLIVIGFNIYPEHHV